MDPEAVWGFARPQPVFSAGRQDTEKCGGVWGVLEALLFIRTNEDRWRKHINSVENF